MPGAPGGKRGAGYFWEEVRCDICVAAGSMRVTAQADLKGVIELREVEGAARCGVVVPLALLRAVGEETPAEQLRHRDRLPHHVVVGDHHGVSVGEHAVADAHLELARSE